MIRDNLPKKLPRCHFNKRGKTKLTFETVEDALLYLSKIKLDYTIYKCKICNKYHIAKKPTQK